MHAVPTGGSRSEPAPAADEDRENAYIGELGELGHRYVQDKLGTAVTTMQQLGQKLSQQTNGFAQERADRIASQVSMLPMMLTMGETPGHQIAEQARQLREGLGRSWGHALLDQQSQSQRDLLYRALDVIVDATDDAKLQEAIVFPAAQKHLS